MPRDVAGNYTLPSGNPVIAHETVEANWANTTMPDIAAALTDSLSRNGNGGMLVPFRFVDGTVGAPGMTFANEPTSGLYRAGLNDVRFSVGAQDVMQITQAGVVLPAGKTFTGNGITLVGGSINGAVIGGTTPAAGTFTTLMSTALGVGTAAAPSTRLEIGAGGAGALNEIVLVNGSSAAGFGPALRFSRNSVVKAQIGMQSQILGDNSDNLYVLPASGTMVVQGTLNPTVRVLTPLVEGAGLLLRSASGDLTFSSATGIASCNSDNTTNWGAPSKRWANGYFGTSVQSPQFFAANSDRPFQSQGAVGNLWLVGADANGDWTLTENTVGPALAIKKALGGLAVATKGLIRETTTTPVNAGSAQTIYTTQGAGSGLIAIVIGVDAGANGFTDFILWRRGAGVITTLGGSTNGAPGTRAYTPGGDVIQLNPSVAQTRVRVFAFESSSN